MPPHRMHMTTLEVTHSRTPAQVSALLAVMRSALPDLTSFTYDHRSRLAKPIISYDLSAIALSFVPAAGEPVITPGLGVNDKVDAASVNSDSYTYHHLRRDIFDLVHRTGVDVTSRYVVPSAHITLGRYLSEDDHATPELRRAWVRTIDQINDWLEAETWGEKNGSWIGEWVVGQEKGLDARVGTLWYGGGRSVMQGEGF
jgi:hypothetical protein